MKAKLALLLKRMYKFRGDVLFNRNIQTKDAEDVQFVKKCRSLYLPPDRELEKNSVFYDSKVHPRTYLYASFFIASEI